MNDNENQVTDCRYIREYYEFYKHYINVPIPQLYGPRASGSLNAKGARLGQNHSLALHAPHASANPEEAKAAAQTVREASESLAKKDSAT